VADGPHRLTLRPAGGGPVELYGVALERDAPGVQLDSLGVVGAQAEHLYSWDWPVLSAQITRRDPRLVILWYGTNEVPNLLLDPPVFEDRLVELVGRLRAAAPRASVLLVAPPDFGLQDMQQAWHTPPRLLDIIRGERRAAERSGAA